MLVDSDQSVSWATSQDVKARCPQLVCRCAFLSFTPPAREYLTHTLQCGGQPSGTPGESSGSGSRVCEVQRVGADGAQPSLP